MIQHMSACSTEDEVTAVGIGSAAGDCQREVDVKSDGTPNGTVTIDGLLAGNTYYFVVTTYDTEERKSLYSSPEIEIKI
ncbi:MAG: hypothetical protein ABUK13_01535 [Gammaproteobacteria bacterium]